MCEDDKNGTGDHAEIHAVSKKKVDRRFSPVFSKLLKKSTVFYYSSNDRVEDWINSTNEFTVFTEWS